MTIDPFWAGVLVLPLLVAAVAACWFLLGLAKRAWLTIDKAIVERVNLAPNPLDPYRRDKNGRPKYLRSANVIRDALLRAPRFYSMRGFGWVIFVARNSKGPKQ